MSQPLRLNCLEWWYDALYEPIGIVLRTNNRDALLGSLFIARKNAADPQLDALVAIRAPFIEDEVWVLHRKVQINEE